MPAEYLEPMKYLSVVGPITQFQSLNFQNLLTNKILREISMKKGHFYSSFKPADSYSRGKEHNLTQSYRIDSSDFIFHSNLQNHIPYKCFCVKFI